MSKAFILLTLSALFLSCSNRMVNGQPHGFWKERDTINGEIFLAKGRYNNGMQVKTWRYKIGKKLVKKEKYRGEDCLVQHYDANRRVVLEGHTKLVINDSIAHWFYQGEWTHFDSVGRRIRTDYYDHGSLIDSTLISNNNTNR